MVPLAMGKKETMKYLSWYVTKTVLLATFVVGLILTSLFIVFTFIANAGDIAPSFGYWDLLKYVLMSLPSSLYMLLPVTGLMGTLLGLGHLASHSELVAMRAAGVSILRIAGMVLLAASMVMVLTFAIGAFLGPYLAHRAELGRMLEKGEGAILLTAKSTWLKEGNNFIYIDSARPDGRLQGIRRFIIDKGQLAEVSVADSGYYQNKAWVLQHVVDTKIQSSQISQKVSAQVSGLQLVPPKMLEVLVNQSGNLMLPGLLSYIHYRKANQLATDRYELQLWQLFFQPISVVILMIMAIPFVFGPLRSSGFGLRLVAGLFLGFVFFLISQSTGPFVLLYRGSPFWGAAAPALIFGGILMLAIWRMN